MQASTLISNRLYNNIVLWLLKNIDVFIFIRNKDGDNSVNNSELREQIKKIMPEKRYIHSLGVADTAVKLAGIYGVSPEKAEMAGLLHDIARDYDNVLMLQMCENYSIVPDDVEKAVPDLLHGKVGACIAEDRFRIKDSEILHAIKFHTTGCKKMSILDKIIFIADMIELGREFPGVERLRESALAELDRSVLEGLNSTIRFVLERGLSIHINSVEARNELLRPL
jgi:nicotinate-nucleotide adenylyltransferase